MLNELECFKSHEKEPIISNNLTRTNGPKKCGAKSGEKY